MIDPVLTLLPLNHHHYSNLSALGTKALSASLHDALSTNDPIIMQRALHSIRVRAFSTSARRHEIKDVASLAPRLIPKYQGWCEPVAAG